jgi:hypothetical protein
MIRMYSLADHGIGRDRAIRLFAEDVRRLSVGITFALLALPVRYALHADQMLIVVIPRQNPSMYGSDDP